MSETMKNETKKTTTTTKKSTRSRKALASDTLPKATEMSEKAQETIFGAEPEKELQFMPQGETRKWISARQRHLNEVAEINAKTVWYMAGAFIGGIAIGITLAMMTLIK